MTAPTVTMKAPSTWGGSLSGTPSGASYIPDANGQVQALYVDVPTLASLGFVALNSAAVNAPLLNAKNIDGSSLAAAASSGKFGSAITLGTSIAVVSEAANNSSVTDSLLLDLLVPAGHSDASALALNVDASIVIGSGVLSVQTLTAHVYGVNVDGTMTADLITAGNAQNIVNAGSVLAWSIPAGSGLAPGQRVIVELTMALTETSTHAVTGHINSVSLQ